MRDMSADVEPLYPLELVTLQNVNPEEIRWLWRGRVARGKLTLVVGDPGDGKSYLTLAIAANVSHGKPLPDSDEPMSPADVILWNGEDGLADTIRVRAERVGADLRRLHVIEGATGTNGNRVPFGLQHLADLYAELKRRAEVELVIIDPIGALLAGVDAHKDAEVRSALQPLNDLARESGVAVLVVAHLNKATAQRALYRVGGSIGFVGLARSVLLVAREHESGRRAVAQIKSNLAEQVAPVEFSIDDRGLWLGGVAEDLSSERLLAAPMVGEERSAFNDARRLIVAAVEESGGEILGRELDRIMRDAGVTSITYRRARAALVRDGLLERRGGNRYQRELRWRSHAHRESNVPNMSQTRDCETA